MTLRPGETLELNTRVGGGVEIHRDRDCTDTFAIDGHGGELSEEEIRRFAEAAGFEVSDGNDRDMNDEGSEELQ